MDATNLDIYGSETIPWSRPLEQLESVEGHLTFWLATTRPDGRPHVTGVGALWIDGQLYFTSGPGTRKSKNLDRNPRCAVSVALPGIDLVLEGSAAMVTDEATLTRVAEAYAATGWPVEVRDGAFTAPFSAPSAGPPPWNLYALTHKMAFGLATAEPNGATRWRFD